MLNPGKSRYLSGKAAYKVLLMLIIIAAGFTDLYAQSGKVDIKIKQPPPNMLGVGDMWNLTLENTTKSDLKIYLTGTATEEKDGLIIEGKSKVFTIKPGKTNYKYNDFSGAEVKYNNGKYKEIILRTGNAPEGSYTICVTAFEESGELAGMENCIMQTVQQLGSITLISPENGAELDPDTLPGLVFSWTPLPNGGPYSLRIVELKGDQSPEVAFRTNPPIFEKEYKSTTTQGDPIHGVDVKLGMKFAWQVSCGDVVSEVGKFTGKQDWDDGSDDFVSLHATHRSNLVDMAVEQPSIIGANILLVSSNQKLAGVSDKNGKYIFENANQGPYQLTINKLESEWITCVIYVYPVNSVKGYTLMFDGPPLFFSNGVSFNLPDGDRLAGINLNNPGTKSCSTKNCSLCKKIIKN